MTDIIYRPLLIAKTSRCALFINTNTRNPKMKRYLCPNYAMINRSGLYNMQTRKKKHF